MENTPYFEILQKVTPLPSALIIRILVLAFMAEHREKYKNVHKQLIKHMYFYIAKLQPIDEKWYKYFKELSLCLHDDHIKTSNILFSCNCCKRHQRRKAIIKNDELSIITKNEYFIPNFKWDGCYVLYDDHFCDCSCRQEGRMIARRWLEKKYGIDSTNYNTNPAWYLGMRPPEWITNPHLHQ